jgi:hypothetical protein
LKSKNLKFLPQVSEGVHELNHLALKVP